MGRASGNWRHSATLLVNSLNASGDGAGNGFGSGDKQPVSVMKRNSNRHGEMSRRGNVAGSFNRIASSTYFSMTMTE
jgi:hypothetical protein